MTLPRPAEQIQATLGVIIGALLIIYGAVRDGFQIDDLTDPEVQGALTLLFGFVAALVTWFVSRRQRDRELGSGADGTVLSTPPT